MKRWFPMTVSALLSLGAVGCASAPVRQDEQALLEATSSQVLYRRPAAEVMEAARAILDERGYTVLPSADPHYVRTGWKVEGDFDFSSRWSRVLIQGRTLPDGRYLVRAFQMQETTVGRAASHPSLGAGSKEANNRASEGTNTNAVAGEPLSAAPVTTHRDTEVEWAILERLEPAFARSLKRQVEVYVANHQPPEELENPPEAKR